MSNTIHEIVSDIYNNDIVFNHDFSEKNVTEDNLMAAWKALSRYDKFDEFCLGKDLNLFNQIEKAIANLPESESEKMRLYLTLQSKILPDPYGKNFEKLEIIKKRLQNQNGVCCEQG